MTTPGPEPAAEVLQFLTGALASDDMSLPEIAGEVVAIATRQPVPDLAEAQHRLDQAEKRISEKYPRASRDGELVSMLCALRDALGLPRDWKDPQ
jgi:hypothetical protein